MTALFNDLIGHAADSDGFSTTFISCFDNTLGTASQGTANWWLNNLGEDNSSDPLGLCGSATV